MLEESVTLLRAVETASHPQTFVDATFGVGGHTAALLDEIPGSRVIAIDADLKAVARAKSLARHYPGRLSPVHGNFADIDQLLDSQQVDQVDGVLYDLGISSLQLDEDDRGFSFGSRLQPLDMRLDSTSADPTASDLLQTLPQKELERILRDYGDEHRASAIARAIVRRRQKLTKWSTSDLVAAVLSALSPSGRRPRQRIHPATRTFQALRIAVNHDLENLQRSLRAALNRLCTGGRIVAISFHSGEDRIVKQQFKEFDRSGLVITLTRKPLRPQAQEVAANRRSRSAKLRAVERKKNTAAAMLQGDA